MNKKLVFTYLIATFIISWSCYFATMILTNIGAINSSNPAYYVIMIMGALGPLFGTIIALVLKGDTQDIEAYKRRMKKWKVNPVYYLTGYAVPITVGYVALITTKIFGLEAHVGFKLDAPIYFLLIFTPVMILGGGLEETGWRGLLLPELLKDFSPIKASLIVGVIWAIWHLPLFLIKGLSQYDTNFIAYTFSCVGLSMFLTFIYLKTKSTLVAIIVHASINANLNVVPVTRFLSIKGINPFVIISIMILIVTFLGMLKFSHEKISLREILE